MRRFFRHFLTPPWATRRAFPKGALEAITKAIKASEANHRGEICFAVEARLQPWELWRKITPRQRALQVFAELGVWDTEGNSGVLIYLLLADRDVEIVADRGISAKVPQDTWQAICQRMEQSFAKGRFQDGVLSGIAEISTLLTTHFPAAEDNRDELPNRPAIL